MTEHVIVSTTTPTREAAGLLAKVLVEARAAACVQVLGPIASEYRWKGELESSEEWLLLIKSTRSRFTLIERLIRENHPYEVPEILASPVAGGSESYLAWLDEAVSP
jgi:periplasmic divalent cation tolerance protein